MTAAEDVQVALRTITDLTATRARGEHAQARDEADLRAALRRAAPAIIEILVTAASKLKDWPGDNGGTQSPAVHLARLINHQPDPHDEAPC